jgi:hypothetical protein
LTAFDWESVAVAGIIGAVSAGIASLIVRPREKRVAFGVLVGLFYVILSQVADTYVRPHLSDRSDLGFLEEEEIYQVLKKHEPDLYAELKTQLEGASRQQSEEQARAVFASTFSQITNKYAPIASDSALVAFMEFTVELGEVIGQQDTELAMKWFYPDQFGRPGSLRSLIGPQLERKMYPALSDLIRSGATMPSVFKADSRIDSLLEILGIELADRYGDEALEALATPSMEDSERHVAMVLSTYKRVFEFPFDERALMLRYMITDDAE